MDRSPHDEVYPANQAAIDAAGVNFRPPGGESMHDVGVRMHDWSLDIARRLPRAVRCSRSPTESSDPLPHRARRELAGETHLADPQTTPVSPACWSPTTSSCWTSHNRNANDLDS